MADERPNLPADVLRLVNEYQEKLERMRPAYEAAKVAQQPGPFRTAALEGAVSAVSAALAAFSPGDTGEKALFILGRCVQIVSVVMLDSRVISEYESLRTTIRKLEQPR